MFRLQNFKKPKTSVPQMVQNAVLDPNFDDNQVDFIRVIMEAAYLSRSGPKEGSQALQELINSKDNTPTERKRAILVIKGIVENADRDFLDRFMTFRLWISLQNIVNERQWEDPGVRVLTYNLLASWYKNAAKLDHPVFGTSRVKVPKGLPPEYYTKRERQMEAEKNKFSSNPFEAAELDLDFVPGSEPGRRPRSSQAIEEMPGGHARVMEPTPVDQYQSSSRSWFGRKDKRDKKSAVEEKRIAELVAEAKVDSEQLIASLQALDLDARPRDNPHTEALYDICRKHRRQVCRCIYKGGTSHMADLLVVNDNLNEAINSFNAFQVDLRDHHNEDGNSGSEEDDEQTSSPLHSRRRADTLPTMPTLPLFGAPPPPTEMSQARIPRRATAVSNTTTTFNSTPATASEREKPAGPPHSDSWADTLKELSFPQIASFPDANSTLGQKSSTEKGKPSASNTSLGLKRVQNQAFVQDGSDLDDPFGDENAAEYHFA